MSVLDARLRPQLDALRGQQRYRARRVVGPGHGSRIEIDGRPYINFCSNDYLGLAADPRLAEAAAGALRRGGTGAGASPLVSGYDAEHRALEEELAAFTGYPRALLFSSGWAANLGTLRALLGRRDVLVADELNHASLIDGGRLSGARYVRVRHADAGAFADALSRESAAARGAQVLAVTDAVFSMDGDRAPLAGLATACARAGAALMVDDAHGFGVSGESGCALAEPAAPRPDVYVATLGKAIGAAGAFVAGSETLVEFLVQRARSWVFSTAPPPAIAAAARAGLAIAQSDEGRQRRAQLRENVARLVAGARRVALPLDLAATPDTPILPLVLGEEGRALWLSAFLFQRGCWVAAIRPPTVPPGTARLRISLSAAHTAADVDQLLEALGEGWRELERGAAPRAA
ncbi:MAG TPA: 8-amino-7-oxononanoate synthase [Candidatus Binatia bacterium]|nr:8-amino-7-oxononanoate synthase [Candidatus Binatia bacterium]